MVEIQLEPGLFNANQERTQYLKVKQKRDLLLPSPRSLVYFAFPRRSGLAIVQESRHGGSGRLCDHSGRDQG